MSLASQPEPSGGQRKRLLDDPRSIRALAHPLRLQLRSIVGRAGRITAAEAARELGISHALASHHLRQLAKYGFVEQVDGPDRKQRPWRIVHTSFSVEGVDDRPGGTAAVAVLEQVMAEQAVAGLADWHERRAGWSAGWRESSGLGRSTLYLTERELTELSGAIEALLLDYAEQRPLDDFATRPPESVAVDFTLIVVPNAPTAEGY